MLASTFRMLAVVIFAVHIFFVISGEADEGSSTFMNFSCVVQPGKSKNYVQTKKVVRDMGEASIQGSVVENCGAAIKECRARASEHSLYPEDCAIAEITYGNCTVKMDARRMVINGKVEWLTNVADGVSCPGTVLFRAVKDYNNADKIVEEHSKRYGGVGWEATTTVEPKSAPAKK